MKFLMKIVLLVFVLVLPMFANSIATITALKGSATIKNISGNYSAKLGYKLEEKDSVITADKSKVQIIFKDETIVTVGKNSNFSISKYLYDAENEPSVQFGLITGAMRTITGKIGKIAPHKFIVKTKTATIGIRGTNFTVIAMKNGGQRAYCTYGAISVTVNNKINIVNQGFYLSLSPDGTITIVKFSSKDLKDMKKDNFGKNKKSNGESFKDDDEESDNGMIIDETVENEKSTTEDETSDDVKNSEQTSDDSNVEKDVILVSGWGANNRYYEDKATVQFKVLESSKTIDTDDSFILDNQDSITQWKYVPKAIPNSYVDTSFESATSNNNYYSNYSIDPAKNYIKIVEDLSPDDAMYWGEWGIKVNYQTNYQNYPASDTYTGSESGPFEDSRDIDGLWVAGELTENSVIASYNQTSVIYNGEYRAYDFSSGISLVSGTAQLDVNFAEDSASLVIMKATDNTSQWASYKMTGADTNHMSGSQVEGSGSADGNFYGTTGDLVGGNFSVSSSSISNDAKGVYEVTRTIK